MQLDELELPDELTTLKERATIMGISYHPKIGVDALRDKVNQHMTVKETPSDPDQVKPNHQEITRQRDELLALVRIRLTCMNPSKREWDGEIITVGNTLVGTVRKYIPFNAPDGWHVPKIMYQALVDRQCQVFSSIRDSKGNNVTKGKLIKEFAIEVLPQLTKDELDELARRQAMSHAID